MIKLNHVFKEYDIDGEVFTALNDITLEIKPGEFTSIIGPSGSGKSTLMHIMGLLDTPTRGSISVNNQDITGLDDNELSELRNQFVGFVFQQFNLIPKLTVLENILIPAVYSRKKLDFDPVLSAKKLLEQFGMSEKINSFPNKLSGGQQQRVAIARALIMNPKIILADEPTGNIDTKTGEAIISILKSLNNERGVTVVLITHDMEIAKKTKKRFSIKDGRLI